MKSVVALFGTRPEVIKLAPVIHELNASGAFRAVSVASGQHTTLLYPLAEMLGIRIDHDLRVMERDQHPSSVCARVLATFDPILASEQPEMVLVQGDTTTALAGALAAFHRRIPVGHVEAGLRSGNRESPFPEEMNRRVIGTLATWHFAATAGNRDALLREGVEPGRIFVTGNPGVDALGSILASAQKGSRPDPLLETLFEKTAGLRRVVLTTHRRESFGRLMAENLATIRRFVQAHDDVAVLCPVHPNPAVRKTVHEALGGHARIHLFEPLDYPHFVQLLAQAWLIVSDSGGVQEEAPTLGRPLLVLRENTERPEVLTSGIARLVGASATRLGLMLEEAYMPGSWVNHAGSVAPNGPGEHRENPFGRGDAASRIVSAIAGILEPAEAGPHDGKVPVSIARQHQYAEKGS